jgi:hypothetical protein
VEVLFYNVDNQQTFVATRADILNITTHNSVRFYVPPGYGQNIQVKVKVAGQVSTTHLPFAYHTPTIADIAMDCGGFDDLSQTFVTGARPCYGYQPQGRTHTRNYPTVTRVVVHDDRTATIVYENGGENGENGGENEVFATSPGSSLSLTGMPDNTFLNTQFIVANASWPGYSAATAVRVLLDHANIQGPATYPGPPGAQIGATYVNVATDTSDFRFMETDACGAQASVRNSRNSGLEPFERWQDRNDQAGASSAGTVLARDCKQATVDRRQRIVIRGNNFAQSAQAPIRVTLQGRTCDCTVLLDGRAAPCRDDRTGLCYGLTSGGGTGGGSCLDGQTHCGTAPGSALDQEIVPLTVEYHGEHMIVVPVVKGFGRYHALSVTVGLTTAAPVVLRYHRPTVTGWMSEGSLTGDANVLKPNGASRLCYLGHNFGQGPSDVMVQVGAVLLLVLLVVFLVVFL